MEGFVEIEVHENSLCLEDEVDVKYEFDAPMFFDFTKDESLLDDCEAEQWFEFATSYPPSRKDLRIIVESVVMFLKNVEKLHSKFVIECMFLIAVNLVESRENFAVGIGIMQRM